MQIAVQTVGEISYLKRISLIRWLSAVLILEKISALKTVCQVWKCETPLEKSIKKNTSILLHKYTKIIFVKCKRHIQNFCSQSLKKSEKLHCGRMQNIFPNCNFDPTPKHKDINSNPHNYNLHFIIHFYIVLFNFIFITYFIYFLFYYANYVQKCRA